MNERDKTVEFNPIKDVDKEKISRSSSDVYSSRRKNSYEHNPRNQENDNNGLIYFAIILTIALIIAIVVGIIIISNSNSIKNEPDVEENIVIPLEEEQEEENDVKEENIYNIIFYGETVKKSGNNYSVAADLYDENLKRVGSRKIIITPDTVIKESGKRMSAEGFVYTIESFFGETISVEGKIREKDNVALTLSYDGSFREEIEENTQEEEVMVEETPEDPLPPVEQEIIEQPSESVQVPQENSEQTSFGTEE